MARTDAGALNIGLIVAVLLSAGVALALLFAFPRAVLGLVAALIALGATASTLRGLRHRHRLRSARKAAPRPADERRSA